MINLPLATNSWDKKEISAIERVIRSQNFTMGKEVEEFEKQFADFFGAKHAVMVNSGSSANLLAVAAACFSKRYNLKKGDEIIVPAVSWVTTFTPLQQYGLNLRFVDIDLNTLNIDLDSIENAITKRTRGIMGVNLLGNSIDYDRLLKIANRHNLFVIEDNCESMGAKFNGRYTGTFGIMGTFSSFFSHHISTMEGGFIVTDDDELRDILVCLRAHGWSRNLTDKSSIYEKKEEQFYESFNFILPGYNLRPLEIQAAIGKEQINKLNSIVTARRKNADIFKQLFGDDEDIIIQKEVGQSSYFGFSIIIKDDSLIVRDRLVEKLKNNGVDCRPIVAGNFVKNPVVRYFDYSIYDCLKNADKVHEQGLFIGNHHYDVKEQLKQVYELIKKLR